MPYEDDRGQGSIRYSSFLRFLSTSYVPLWGSNQATEKPYEPLLVDVLLHTEPTALSPIIPHHLCLLLSWSVLSTDIFYLLKGYHEIITATITDWGLPRVNEDIINSHHII